MFRKNIIISLLTKVFAPEWNGSTDRSFEPPDLKHPNHQVLDTSLTTITYYQLDEGSISFCICTNRQFRRFFVQMNRDRWQLPVPTQLSRYLF